MTALRELKVGDRVQVFDRYGHTPAGGWDGTVTKVGRTLLHVVYGRGSQPVQFRLDTGVINGTYGHVRVKTPEQAADDQRRAEAEKRLGEVGLRVQIGYRLSTDTLVALAAALDQRGVGGAP